MTYPWASGEVLTAADLNAALGPTRILQVVSTTKTDTFTVTSTTYTNVTGMSATITPSSTSSKILVIATGNMQWSTGLTETYIRLARNTTGIAVGDASASRPVVSAFTWDLPSTQMMMTLDSPNTTSATTYWVQIRSLVASAAYFNRTFSDPNGSTGLRLASSITVMEVVQ